MENNKLDELVNRLQKLNNLKYPDKQWTLETYENVKFAWSQKQEELEKHVLNLESKL